LDLVHRVYFNKITTFWKLDLLPSSGKKERTKILTVGPPGSVASDSPGLRLAQPGCPTAGISVLSYLKTEEDPASETYIYRNINDGQGPKTVLHIVSS
jgi:hypothetical protein